MTGFIGENYVPRGVFFVVRDTFPALRQTIYKEFNDMLHEYGFARYVEHRKSTHEFIFEGREIVFFSTDDETKLKGRQNTFFWINEATDVPFEHFGQLIRRNTHWCYLDYNPVGEPWVKTEIEEKRADEENDVFLHVSTYTQNPFLPAAMIKEIEAIKNPDLRDIYFYGKWVKRAGRVFPILKTFTEWPDVPGSIYWGLDFGMTDPSVLVEVRIYEANKQIYIKELLHAPGVLLTDISQAMYANNVGRVVCDGADPRSIDELRRRGNRVQASFKGSSSVIHGINRILQYDIFICGAKVLEDFKRYHWKTNLTGEVLPVPDHDGSHSIDATRYSISYSMRAKIRLI